MKWRNIVKFPNCTSFRIIKLVNKELFICLGIRMAWNSYIKFLFLCIFLFGQFSTNYGQSCKNSGDKCKSLTGNFAIKAKSVFVSF